MKKINTTPTHRQLSIADLEKITGITFKPLKKRLDDLEPVRIDGVKKLYDSKEALPLIYQIKDQHTLDLTQERAKLAKVQTQKIELDIKKQMETLVDAENFMKDFQQSMISLREKLLQLGDSISQEILDIEHKNTDNIGEIINNKLHEFLTDISDTHNVE